MSDAVAALFHGFSDRSISSRRIQPRLLYITAAAALPEPGVPDLWKRCVALHTPSGTRPI